MKIAPQPGIFVSRSSAERARNFPATENSAARRTAGPSIQRQIESRSGNCWDRRVSGRWALGPMMEWHSLLQADPAVPELVVRMVAVQLAAARMVAAQAVAEVPLVAERNRMD